MVYYTIRIILFKNSKICFQKWYSIFQRNNNSKMVPNLKEINQFNQEKKPIKNKEMIVLIKTIIL